MSSHCLIEPALSRDATLRMAKRELETIPGNDMYIFFKKGTNGRVSYISNKCRKTSNKYLKSYGPREELNHII